MFKQNVNKTTALTGPCESPAVSKHIKYLKDIFLNFTNFKIMYVTILVWTGFEVFHELKSKYARCDY